MNALDNADAARHERWADDVSGVHEDAPAVHDRGGADGPAGQRT
jgi:hypothetical protein